MGTNILNIGKSALMSAQIGMNTTANNIANVKTPGYSRQAIIQGATAEQSTGVGFLGQGSQILAIRRQYSDHLGQQVLTAQISQASLKTYHEQIAQIDNMVADPTVGLASVLQNFFNGVHDVVGNPADPASRQSMISSGAALSARFQVLNNSLNELRGSLNRQISEGLTEINSHASQIASLNDLIEKSTAQAGGQQPNGLLDQRDLLISELSKIIKVSIVPQGSSYNVFIGSGQPLVVNGVTYSLTATSSPTDPNRTQISYVNGSGNAVTLAENNIIGGKLGGLFDFRAKSLDPTQNSLGRIAIGLATAFNEQQKLGQDLNGQPGVDLFKVSVPRTTSNTFNKGSAQFEALITNVNQLTSSDYRLKIITAAVPPAPAVPTTPGVYALTRLSDNSITTFSSFPQTIDGVTINLKMGNFADNDEFLIQPTVNGAREIALTTTDITRIAAAAPLSTALEPSNIGNAKISPGIVNSGAIIPALTINYSGGFLSGFPAHQSVTVTTGGIPTTYPAGTPVPYSAAPGNKISFAGIEISGVPNSTFTLSMPITKLTFNAGPPQTISGFPPFLDVSVSTGGITNSYENASSPATQAAILDANNLASVTAATIGATPAGRATAATAEATAIVTTIATNPTATAATLGGSAAISAAIYANVLSAANAPGATASSIATVALAAAKEATVTVNKNAATNAAHTASGVATTTTQLPAIPATISATAAAAAAVATYAGAPANVVNTIANAANLAANAAGATPSTVANAAVAAATAANQPATLSVPYTSGAETTISYGGFSFTLSGTPKSGDVFTIKPNINGVGDGRNANILATLQTKNSLGNNTLNYQSAYAQLVSEIGNKTREMSVTSTAEGKLLNQTIQAQQNESGVNLDEEAANLMRYQQAYEAAAKVIKIAADMFSTLLQLGQR